MANTNKRWGLSAYRSALGVTGLVGLGAISVSGCLNRPVEPVEPRTTSTLVERLTQSSVNKIDLLLAIDNSRSMADKQEILQKAVPDLVNRLVNPNCVNKEGAAAPTQPAVSTEDCPEGFEREFEPIVDIHIGIISSSIGGYGAVNTSCKDLQQSKDCVDGQDDPGDPNTSANDKGQLLARSKETGNPPPAVGGTYQGLNFLAWDPTGKLTPKGEANPTTLSETLATMVKGVGQLGCGYEAQLESVYRFLIDPDPYATIGLDAEQRVVKTGTDDVLINQRKAFLRPDSLLAVIMLTDENDCSVKEEGFAWQIADANQKLPRGTSTCETNPGDKCCYNCSQPPPEGCSPDPVCDGAPQPADEDVNLRCFDQKRRYGIDFLYPISRYVTGFTSATVPNRAGEAVANPIFQDLDPTDENSTVRDSSLVFVAGIVGVPWQDIAIDKNDLSKGFKTAEQMTQDTGKGGTTWDIVVGDLAKFVAPKDPLMIESTVPRTGTSPIVEQELSKTYNPEIPNGNEWDAVDSGDDLQYACIFPLEKARECSTPSTRTDCKPSCDCDAAGDVPDDKDTNPLCENGAAPRSLQTRAKAYPGLRELGLLKDLGPQGIVASVCPAQLDDLNRRDYGYRPAVATIVDRLKQALRGQCLPRQLTPNEEGRVPCLVLEATVPEGGCAQACAADGRKEVDPSAQAAVDAVREDEFYQTKITNGEIKSADRICVCEIEQLVGKEQEQCQNTVEKGDLTADGWCYVDPYGVPAAGTNKDVVADCPVTERRIIRFSDKGNPVSGSTVFITCSGE